MRCGRSGAITILAAISFLLLLQCHIVFAADESANVEVSFASGTTEVDTVKEDVPIFTNRPAVFHKVPAEMIGLTFTKRAGGHPVPVVIDAPANSVVYLVIDDGTGPNKVPAQ